MIHYQDTCISQDTHCSCQDIFVISRHNHIFQDTVNNFSRCSFKILVSRHVLCMSRHVFQHTYQIIKTLSYLKTHFFSVKTHIYFKTPSTIFQDVISRYLFQEGSCEYQDTCFKRQIRFSRHIHISRHNLLLSRQVDNLKTSLHNFKTQ